MNIHACPHLNIEPLETRIAPASVFLFTDVDGDKVTVTSSLGTLDASDFTFTGTTALQLQKLTLDATFAGAIIGITVKAGPGGNGSVQVGEISAPGVDLKSVSIAGDLGRIVAGGGVVVGTAFPAASGLGSLTVDSLGRGGTAVQLPGAGLVSDIQGNLGKLVVKGDISAASIEVDGNIGAITLGGSLIGGAAPGSGLIVAGRDAAVTGTVGLINISGSIHGRAGDDSGQIFAEGAIAGVTVGGDIAGGTGNRSGAVISNGNIGAVLVKGSILGNAQADPTDINVGAVFATGTLKSLTVGDSIRGGAGTFGGYVFAGGAMGPVKITVDVRGDSSIYANFNSILTFAAPFNGGVQSGTSMGSVFVGGSVVGGRANYSGVIFVGNEDFAGTDAVPGVPLADDPGDDTGIVVARVTPGTMGSVTIKGSLVGGGLWNTFPDGKGGAASGWIKADGPMGAVNIVGDLAGGVGPYSGSIQSRDSIAAVTVLGSLRGGGGYASASIFTGSPDIILNPPGGGVLGPVKITGSLLCGMGNLSGTLSSDTLIKSVTIGGSIVGDLDGAIDDAIVGGGAVISYGALGPIVVKGSVLGGLAPGGGGIYAFGGNITSVNIGRDLTGATATTGIYAAGTIGSVMIGGSIAGSAPGTGTVFILADGTSPIPNALAIGKITVKGRVENADILAGSNFYHSGPVVTAANADAGIGPVTVGGDWIASNLAAGVNSSGAPFFGRFALQTIADSNLTAIPSRIASIIITGNVLGTPGTANDGFGFFAQQIGSLKIHGAAQNLTPGVDALLILGDPLGDTVLSEFVGT